MGIGSKLKKAARSLDSRISGVVKDPLSSTNIKTAGSLFTGIPIELASNTARSGFDSLFRDAKNRAEKTVSLNDANKWQKKFVSRTLDDATLSLEDRRKIGIYAGYAVIVVAVVVVCIYSIGTGCLPAVGAGLTAAGALSGADKAYTVGKQQQNVQRDANLSGIPNMYPSSVGGAGSELLAGDFSGLFTSLDPNTAAGMKTILFLGGMATLTAGAYFGVRYFRR